MHRRSTCTASTAMCAKKSESPPVILEDIDVFAALSKVSLPRLDVGIASFSSMYLHACRTHHCKIIDSDAMLGDHAQLLNKIT